MASSFSARLRLEMQLTGENLNTWGAKLSNTLARVDDAIAGYVALTIPASGNYTLTSTNSNTAADEARMAHLKLIGSPTANFTLTVPAVSKAYWIWNATGKTVTVTTGSGNTATVENGDVMPVWCDGTNVKSLIFGGYSLKNYIDAAILATTGSLPATTGNDGKALICVAGAWTPTQITSTYLSSWTSNAAAVRTGTSTTLALTPGDTYSAFAEVTLTDAATVAVDMATFINARVTLGGNRTLGNPTNPKVGQSGYIAVVQDGTGSRTLAFAANWKRDGGAPTLSTAAGAIDFIFYQVITSSYIVYSFAKAPS